MGRSPHGERGLKYYRNSPYTFVHSRSPHGERGLKCSRLRHRSLLQSRSPHGERGLKCMIKLLTKILHTVALLTESVD